MKPNRTQMDKMTTIEFGINHDKEILVPSFGTTGSLFARHFDILRNLKRRVILLQQAYEDQKDETRSWAEVKEILKVLNTGCEFLTFDDITANHKELYYVDPGLEEAERKAKELAELKERLEAQKKAEEDLKVDKQNLSAELVSHISSTLNDLGI